MRTFLFAAISCLAFSPTTLMSQESRAVFYTRIHASIEDINQVRLSLKEKFPNLTINQVLASSNGDQTLAAFWTSNGDFEPGITTVLDAIFATPNVTGTETYFGTSTGNAPEGRVDGLVGYLSCTLTSIQAKAEVVTMASTLRQSDSDIFAVAQMIGDIDLLIAYKIDPTSVSSIGETMANINAVFSQGVAEVTCRSDHCPQFGVSR